MHPVPKSGRMQQENTPKGVTRMGFRRTAPTPGTANTSFFHAFTMGRK